MGEESKALRVGWMMFGEYCKLRGIKQDGRETRMLNKLGPEYKADTTPNSKRKLWAVNVNEADKVFEKGEE